MVTHQRLKVTTRPDSRHDSTSTNNWLLFLKTSSKHKEHQTWGGVLLLTLPSVLSHWKTRNWLIDIDELQSQNARINPKTKPCSINSKVCTLMLEQASYNNSSLSFKGALIQSIYGVDQVLII